MKYRSEQGKIVKTKYWNTKEKKGIKGRIVNERLDE